MKFEQLLKEVCRRGRESARAREHGQKLTGALRGFDIAEAAENPPHLEELLIAERQADNQAMEDYHNSLITIDDYWEQRYCTLQVEFVYEVVNVGVRLKPTVSARAVRVYADIVGVAE